MLLIQPINHPSATQHHVELFVLRLDLIHPLVSGNKWFKLKYNLQTAISQNCPQNSSVNLDLNHPQTYPHFRGKILTFGGAYSNHIYATAAAGKLFHLPTIGIIRGEEHLPLNPTLDFAQNQGMQLVYVSREIYKQKHTPAFHQELTAKFGDIFIIPEGGCNLDGIRGCTEILAKIKTETTEQFDIICLACGTATTLVGITLSTAKNQQVIGFPVLKGGEYLKSAINDLLHKYLDSNLPVPGDKSLNWQLVCDYHFGGYGKINQELLHFQKEFAQTQGITLDYIYTAKMFYGVIDLIKQGYFRHCRLLLIHTGGIQGNQGIAYM